MTKKMKQVYDVEWVRKKFDKGEALDLLFFWGHTNKHNEDVGKACFSQWFPSPFSVDGIEYKTTEHWMMAKKALLFNDAKSFREIIAAETPNDAKRMGRKVLGFDETVWNERRFAIVKQGNVHKFNQHPKLADYLLHTGQKIIAEASPVDAVWGIGLSQDSKDARNPHGWRGLNLLGFALMEVRDVLAAGYSNGG